MLTKRNSVAIVQPMSDAMTNEIASRLRVIREASGITHKELAESSGMSPATISHIECGRQRPLAAQLAALALALGVPVSDLYPAALSPPRRVRKAG